MRGSGLRLLRLADHVDEAGDDDCAGRDTGRDLTVSSYEHAPPRRAPGMGRIPGSLRMVHLLLAIDVLSWAAATLVLGRVALAFGILLVIIIALNATGGLYAPRLTMSVLDTIPQLLGRALVAGAVVVALKLVAGEAVGVGLIRTAALYAGLAALGRALTFPAVRWMRSAGWRAHPTLVIGAGKVGKELVEVLRNHPEYGLRPIGFVDDDPLLGMDERPVPVLGETDRLADILVENHVRTVIVAFGGAPGGESTVVDVLRTCDRLACEIFYVPRLYELQSAGKDMDRIWSFPVARLRRAPFRSATWRIKRMLDVAAAACALLFLAPALALCAVAVRFGVGRPILFRQVRVGLDGRCFTMLKFRSLTPVDEGESSTRWSIAEDDRLTRIGRIMRKTSLDELPQLWNVLRGDMSLVGPRPERPAFVLEFTQRFPRYMSRHRVPAGVTGWAQVHGLRGDTSIEDRARFDNDYIENWSLWSDAKIMFRTLGQVLGGGGG